MLSRFSLADRKEALLVLMSVGVPEIAFELTDLVVVHRHGPEVVKQAIFGIEERVGRCLLYTSAHSAFIFLSIGVIALAIDASHGFENASVFIDLIHVHQYR